MLNFKWPRSGHKLMTGLFLELEESFISARRGRNEGSVLTRDQSDWNDAAKIEQSLFQKKYNA